MILVLVKRVLQEHGIDVVAGIGGRCNGGSALGLKCSLNHLAALL